MWFTELDDIKDVIVKRGVSDKIFGTGKVYPITPEHPYEPIPQTYGEGNCSNLITEYNIVTKEYDSMTEMEHFKQLIGHPCLEGLTEPYVIQKLLKDAIFGAGTNYVSCKYCYARFDLNKEGKRPNCGGTQTQEYSIV